MKSQPARPQIAASLPWTPLDSLHAHALARCWRRAPGWLLSTVWGPGYQEETNVRVHVGRLRRKLEQDPANPRLIMMEPGLGYRWAAGA